MMMAIMFLTIDEDPNGNGDPTNDDFDNDGLPDYLDAEHAPDALDDEFTVGEDSSNVIDVLGNDIDPDGEIPFVFAVGMPDHGATTINGGTDITYTPAENFFGTEVFTYTIGDGNGGFDTATVTIVVTSINDPPTISDMANYSTKVNNSIGPIVFAIGDLETLVDDLVLSAQSSNPALLPVDNIVFGGSGINRTMNATPTDGLTGTTTITISVDDGKDVASDIFLVIIEPYRVHIPLIINASP